MSLRYYLHYYCCDVSVNDVRPNYGVHVRRNDELSSAPDSDLTCLTVPDSDDARRCYSCSPNSCCSPHSADVDDELVNDDALDVECLDAGCVDDWTVDDVRRNAVRTLSCCFRCYYFRLNSLLPFDGSGARRSNDYYLNSLNCSTAC